MFITHNLSSGTVYSEGKLKQVNKNLEVEGKVKCKYCFVKIYMYVIIAIYVHQFNIKEIFLFQQYSFLFHHMLAAVLQYVQFKIICD